jgi:hypothetical protein
VVHFTTLSVPQRDVCGTFYDTLNVPHREVTA